MSFITKVFSAFDFGLWDMWFLVSSACMAQSFHTDKHNHHITGRRLKIELPEFLSKLTDGRNSPHGQQYLRQVLVDSHSNKAFQHLCATEVAY